MDNMEQQIVPEALKALLQQEQQPAQKNLTIGGLNLLLPTLNELEFIALQGDLQSVVNHWLRQRGMLI